MQVGLPYDVKGKMLTNNETSYNELQYQLLDLLNECGNTCSTRDGIDLNTAKKFIERVCGILRENKKKRSVEEDDDAISESLAPSPKRRKV